MKKLFSLLAIGTMISTNWQSANMVVLNTNLNQKINANGIKNLKSDPIV